MFREVGDLDLVVDGGSDRAVVDLPKVIGRHEVCSDSLGRLLGLGLQARMGVEGIDRRGVGATDGLATLSMLG